MSSVNALVKGREEDTVGGPDNAFWIGALEGETFGEYRFVEYLGAGAFTIVFDAVHLPSGDHVAVKVLPPGANATSQAEFANEATLLSSANSCSNVVRLFDSDHMPVPLTLPGTTSGVVLPMQYHALEIAEGCLEELVLHRDRLTWIERLKLWRGVILGTHQLHLRRIAHRDLKSENCLLFLRPKSVTECKVADLGRSRDLRENPIHSPLQYSVGLGDPRFAPPEFLTLQGVDSKEQHLRADLYGLGSVLYELATGQGVTSMAMGYGYDVLAENLRMKNAGMSLDLSALVAPYENAFQVFSNSLPPVLRSHALPLMRQLCSPQPEKRVNKSRFGRPDPDPGLNWLLRRADILIRSMAAAEVSASKGAS